MPLYRLKCVMRSTDGRSGSAFDNTDIKAGTAEDAIAQAKATDLTGPHMSLHAAILSDAKDMVIWTLRAPPPAH